MVQFQKKIFSKIIYDYDGILTNSSPVGVVAECFVKELLRFALSITQLRNSFIRFITGRTPTDWEIRYFWIVPACRTRTFYRPWAVAQSV